MSRCVIVATLHWISSAPLPMLELFSSRVSVDQDLSVMVAETINDDDVKQRLVQIVFHARLTQQARRHDSRAPMCMKRTNPTLANKGSRKREPHKLMLKTWRTLETRLIVQQCAQQHILLSYVCMQTNKVTKLLNSRQKNQGYQKTWSAQRIQTIVKHTSRPLLQNTTVDCSYNS